MFELRHSGDPLSWQGQLGDHLVRCRLDRAVANSLWAENYPTARCQYLDYEGSDHKPLLSFFEPAAKRRKGLFRYDRRLNDNGEVKDIFLDAWQNSGTIPIKDKIANARVAITEWNKTQHRNSRHLIEEKKTELEAALCSPVNNITLIHDINSQLNNAYLAEEAYWKKRSRLLWLKLGDRNTGFFHATTKGRKRANSFSVLEDAEGTVCYKEEEISKIIV